MFESDELPWIRILRNDAYLGRTPAKRNTCCIGLCRSFSRWAAPKCRHHPNVVWRLRETGNIRSLHCFGRTVSKGMHIALRNILSYPLISPHIKTRDISIDCGIIRVWVWQIQHGQQAYPIVSVCKKHCYQEIISVGLIGAIAR